MPADPDRRRWTRTAQNLVLGRLGWLLGAPMLVLGCGLLVLWWSYVQQSLALYDVESRATQSAPGRVVERYYLLQRVDLSTRPMNDVCPDLCQVEIASVAVIAFEDGARGTRRVEFRDSAVHDWQHNTAFELGVPATSIGVRVAPEVQRWMEETTASSAYDTTLWSLFWNRFDNAAHWLLRVRDPAVVATVPLRYDPADPATALLDAPALAQQRERHRKDVVSSAWVLPVLIAVACVVLIWPAVQLMTRGMSKRASLGVLVAILLTVPWWAPHGTRLAPWLSDVAGELARGMSREFGRDYHPAFLSWTRPPERGLVSIPWSLERSDDARFLQGVSVAPSTRDPLDHVGALDEIQASIAAQLAARDDAAVLAALQPLNHYEAIDVLELFVPALLALQRDPARGPEVQAQAGKLLGFFVADWRLPDVDVFLYAARLDRYEAIASAPDAPLAAMAREKLAAARALVARQEATY